MYDMKRVFGEAIKSARVEAKAQQRSEDLEMMDHMQKANPNPNPNWRTSR